MDGFHGGVPRPWSVPGKGLGWYVAQYDGEIAAVDAEVGKLLEALDGSAVRDRTLVVITSDHGESLGEHDYYFDHGENLFDPAMRIPLIVAGPGVTPGRRTDVLATTLDLVPTILDAVKVSYPPDLAGESLLPAARGERRPDRPRLQGQNDRNLLGAWDRRFKIVATPSDAGARYALYDRETDPGETRDESRAQPGAGARGAARARALPREDRRPDREDAPAPRGPVRGGAAQRGGVREAQGDGLRAAGLLVSVLDLSRALVAEEIVRVRAEGWSGVLALTQGEVAKGLYFVDGAIAFAASTVEEDRLAACLFRAGKITEGQFRAAMRESEATGRPLGHTFVELGYLTPEDLAQARSSRRRSASSSRCCGGRPGRCGASRWSGRSRPTSRSTSTRTGCCSWGHASSPTRSVSSARWERPSAGCGACRPGPSTTRRWRPRRPSARCSPCARGPSPSRTCWPCPSRARSSRARSTLSLAGGLVDDAPARVAPVPLVSGRRRPGRDPGASAGGDGPAADPGPPPPQTPEDAERAARGLLEKGFRQRAIEVLQDAADRYPEARGPRRLLAMTLAREGEFQPSVEKLFSSLLEKETHDVELRYALASYYRRSGMAARAILQLRLVALGRPRARRRLAGPGRAGGGGDPAGSLSAGSQRQPAPSVRPTAVESASAWTASRSAPSLAVPQGQG